MVLAEPKPAIGSFWEHKAFVGETLYSFVIRDGVPAIRAIGDNSASGLYKNVEYRVRDLPWLEWNWRVDRLQNSANLAVKKDEDFAAALFVIFGKPSLFNLDVPTLSYVWTGPNHAKNSVVNSTRRPQTKRHIIVRNAMDALGVWTNERRNVVEDYRRAFGKAPPEYVRVIALFTDNDQTGEAVEAYYGTIRALSR